MLGSDSRSEDRRENENRNRPRTRLYHPKDSETTSRRRFKSDLIPGLAQIQDGFPIELLPCEILYMIFELLDHKTLLNCMYINKKWKCIALNVANADKTNEIWKSIINQTIHQHHNTIVQKTNNLTINEFFANSIRWCHVHAAYIECTYTYKMMKIKKIHVYKDNIIVVERQGVTYYDAKTNEMRRQLSIPHCSEFLETDDMIIKGTEQCLPNSTILYRLVVFGKSNPSDFSMQVDAAMTIEDYGNRLFYRIDKTSCYILNYKHIMRRYTWYAEEEDVRCKWQLHSVGRFFGTAYKAVAMNVLNSELYMLLNSGKMIRFKPEWAGFEHGMNIRLPMNKHKLQATMVHLFSVVFAVSADSEFRITRYKNKLRGNTFFKFECPNLSCVMEHGEMIFLGYNDGKVEIYMPRATERTSMFKRRFNIEEFDKESLPEHRAVVGIEVFEDIAQHHLFVATRTRMYHLLITYADPDVWINANFPDILPLCLSPVRKMFECGAYL